MLQVMKRKKPESSQEKPLIPDEIKRETAKKRWQEVVSQVPESYDFIIKTFNEGFAKHSQVFLCYGRMSNRESLK